MLLDRLGLPCEAIGYAKHPQGAAKPLLSQRGGAVRAVWSGQRRRSVRAFQRQAHRFAAKPGGAEAAGRVAQVPRRPHMYMYMCMHMQMY